MLIIIIITITLVPYPVTHHTDVRASAHVAAAAAELVVRLAGGGGGGHHVGGGREFVGADGGKARGSMMMVTLAGGCLPRGTSIRTPPRHGGDVLFSQAFFSFDRGGGWALLIFLHILKFCRGLLLLGGLDDTCSRLVSPERNVHGPPELVSMP